MIRYLALLRGINVGGQNKLPMARLKLLLEDLGLENVATYIQSGNAVFQTKLAAKTVAGKIEGTLAKSSELNGAAIKVLVLSREQLQAVVDKRPKGFGGQPDTYHSDAIFLMGIEATEALRAFSPLKGVDTISPGNGIIYSQRLSTKRTKSRLNRMMASPLYKSMTLRSWSTTLKLLDLLNADAG